MKRLEVWSNLKNRTQEKATSTWRTLLPWVLSATESPLNGILPARQLRAPASARGRGATWHLWAGFLLSPSDWDDYWKSQSSQNQIGFSLFSLLHLTAGYKEKLGSQKAYFRCLLEGERERGRRNCEQETIRRTEWKRQNSAEAISLVANSLWASTAHII